MKKFLPFLFVAVVFSCYTLHGQNSDTYVQHQIDSLDRIRPIVNHRLKLSCRHQTIKVSNQMQFDKLNEDIKKMVGAGKKNIKVELSEGIYRFKNNHIMIGRVDYEDVSIVIEGHNAVVTSDADYGEGNYGLSPWDELLFADENIKVVDADKKLCLIPFKNEIVEGDKSKCKKVQVTQWYKAPVYNVDKIDKRGIYFTATEIKSIEAFGRKGYTVNYDYLYSGKTPRFRLYNADRERKCIASTFARLEDSHIKLFGVKGIRFKGTGAGASVFDIRNVKVAQIVISDCLFDVIKGWVLNCVNTNNVSLENCSIKNTVGDEVSFTEGCRNIRVVNNVFENCGQGLSNSLCIRCNESEYYIANNIFRDFGYCAIAVGLWHGHQKKHDTKGIVEHNEIYFTPVYVDNKEKHTLMDGGAIYVWTQNDGAIIRYNYIHDYVGMRSYSGIYCDDGASNCKIYRNVVLNTPDGCSITSRKVADLKDGWQNNKHNFIADNIVDGSIIFEGYGTEERHCVKGKNVRLANEVRQQYSDRLNNLEISAEDIEVSAWERKNGKLSVPVKYRRIVKKAGLTTVR